MVPPCCLPLQKFALPKTTEQKMPRSLGSAIGQPPGSAISSVGRECTHPKNTPRTICFIHYLAHAPTMLVRLLYHRVRPLLYFVFANNSLMNYCFSFSRYHLVSRGTGSCQYGWCGHENSDMFIAHRLPLARTQDVNNNEQPGHIVSGTTRRKTEEKLTNNSPTHAPTPSAKNGG